MPEATCIHPDLSFLIELLGDRKAQYRNCRWLQDSFDALSWCYRFGDRHKIAIDFRVRLDDQRLLTDSAHLELLDVFKYWQLIQCHPDSSGGKSVAPAVAYQRVSRALHVIDYLLLNSNRLELASNGLACITENDLIELLATVAKSNEIANSVYGWNDRLSAFLLDKINNTPIDQLEAAIEAHPQLAEIHVPDEDRLLRLEDRQLALSKAWLFAFGYYKRSHKRELAMSPNTERLAHIIYRDTLWGKTKKPIPDELSIEPRESYYREKPGVPIRKDDEDIADTQKIGLYARTIKSLSLASQFGLSTPGAALNSFDTASVLRHLRTSTQGRYKTLPPKLVLDAIRSSVEFALEYGDSLLCSYVRLAKAASIAKLPCGIFVQQYGLEQYLDPKIHSLGVRTWTVHDYLGLKRTQRRSIPKGEYFRELRNNRGLWELLSIFFGSVAVCIGSLSARRQGELLDLKIGNCLDVSRSNLVFQNRKSGTLGFRETEARPIPPIAVRMIEMLDGLHESLRHLGLADDNDGLFAIPAQSGNRLYQSGHQRYNASLDIFCDYFQTPLDKDGRRFYIRQHQLRRFFAMMFFWGSSLAGMETLRWFLGHTDVAHLYHYITESIPGEVLRSVKAQFATAQIKDGVEAARGLAELLQTRFGTSEFSVLDSDELDEYIEELLDDGRVEIEPQFIETPDGQNYRILIQVTSPGARNVHR